MEAIKPGSSSSVKVEHYETVSLRVEDSPYSYVSLPRSPFRSKSSAQLENLYDEPRNFLLPQPQPIHQNNDTHQSRALSGDEALKKNEEHSSTNNPDKVNIQSHQHIPDLSEKLKGIVSPANKGEEEELEKLDQYQLQLRFLDQIQRRVQKLENVHVSDVVGLPFELPNPTQPTVLESENTETSENQNSAEIITSEIIPESPSHVSMVSNPCVEQDKANGSQYLAIGSTKESKHNDAEQQPNSALQSSESRIRTIQAHDKKLEVTLNSEESTDVKLYENLDSDGHHITTPLSVTGQKIDPVDGNDDNPRPRLRAKMMIKGEHKSPVDLRLLDQSENYTSQKAMISEYP